jgi:hypothetical protein
MGADARRRLEAAMAWGERPWRGAEAGAEEADVAELVGRRDSLLAAAGAA